MARGAQLLGERGSPGRARGVSVMFISLQRAPGTCWASPEEIALGWGTGEGVGAGMASKFGGRVVRESPDFSLQNNSVPQVLLYYLKNTFAADQLL